MFPFSRTLGYDHLGFGVPFPDQSHLGFYGMRWALLPAFLRPPPWPPVEGIVWLPALSHHVPVPEADRQLH